MNALSVSVVSVRRGGPEVSLQIRCPLARMVAMPPPARSATPLMTRLQNAVEGRYSVEAEIDRGGRGAVYRAHDLKHARQVAIKVMLPDVADAVGAKRFLQEISIASRLNHPHILPLHDSGESDGLIYYVMPFVVGKSLRDRLNREGRLPLEDATRIAGEVGSALDRAHREGVIHRDIKPANILLIGHHAAVTDFGIARAIDAADNLAETGTGVFVGTAAYMSPEQVSGSAEIDGRCDLYSLGCTVFEMLAGRPPFVARTLRHLITQHIVAPVPSLRSIRPEVPEHVEVAVTRALAKEPGDRFDTLMDFANALNRPPATRSWMRGGTSEARDTLWNRIRYVLGSTPKEQEPLAVPEAGSESGRPVGGDGPTPSPTAQRELRQLTVMCCGAVPRGSASEGLEVNAEVAIFGDHHRILCEEAVARFEGQIVEYGPRGLVAHFGYPIAHEDAPIRAGLAALRLLGKMRRLEDASDEGRDTPPSARIGIHTGTVVIGPNGTEVGESGMDEPLRVGQALRDHAPPDGILVSDVTLRLFRAYFTCQEMGLHDIAGMAEPVMSYRLLAESGVGRQLESCASGDLPALVGREGELDAILESWRRAREGAAQMVLVTGEAGIGKSHLVAAVRSHARSEPHVLLEAACSPYYTNTALYAVILLLRRWLGIHRDEGPEEQLRKLEAGVQRYLGTDPEAVTLLAGLLSIPLDQRTYPRLSLEPAQERRRTLDLLLKLIRSSTAHGPVLLILDDLHWVDPSTLEFLTMWLDRARMSRTLVLLTARPQFTPSWNAPHVRQITLAGLAEEEVARVVEGLTGGRALPPGVVDEIVKRADGIPLFIEEITKALVESDFFVEARDGYEVDGPLPSAAIPLTLRDALTARIDRLGSAKGLVQLGAVIGRRFSANLLFEVSELEDWLAVSAELGRAVDAGVLESSGSGPQTRYTFRHALIQETAYQSLMPEARQGHHMRISQALERSFPEVAAAHPEHLAHHCAEAGAVEKAVSYWLQAGQDGFARAAFAESENHLKAGLRLLDSLAEGTERSRSELLLLSALGRVLQASKGFAAPEVSRVYARARALCKRGGGIELLFPVLWGHHTFLNVRAEYRASEEVARDMIRLAAEDDDSSRLLIAYLASALTHLYLGDLVVASAEFEQGIVLYRPGDWPNELYASEPRCICHSYLARTQWILGEVDRALESSHESLSIARSLEDRAAQMQALGMHTLLLVLRRDNEEARHYAAETIEHATRYGFVYWQVLGAMFQSWLIAQEGRTQEGIAQFSRCLDLYQGQGAKLGVSWFFAGLAEMKGRNGQVEESLTLLSEALAHVEETDERYYEAEIHRLQGEMMLLRGGPGSQEDAEACFGRALRVSRAQEAGSWELRASISQARLCRDQGRLEEARKLIEPFAAIAGRTGPSPDHRDALHLLECLGTA